jgi:hypothetical protein
MKTATIELDADNREKVLQLHRLFQGGLRQIAWNIGKKTPDSVVGEYRVLPEGNLAIDLKA